MENEIIRLRHEFREGRAALFSAEARTGPGRQLLARHTALIDGLVEEIYRISCSFADERAPRGPHADLAIVATGGYGRGELSPFSDIDIAFIPSEEENAWAEAAIHMAFRLVMDVFLSFRKVRVGYSYRPISEVSTWDLPTLSALLDARHLCGARHLTQELARRLRRHLCPLDLLLEVQSNACNRHRTHGTSLYSAEPNLKDGPGSLRDLHRARWVYKLLLGVDDAEVFTALEGQGCLPSGESEKILAAAEWSWRTRNWLHMMTGKCTDVLMSNYQDRIAHEFGFGSACEWLSWHYAHAETLAAFHDSALRRILLGPVEVAGARVENGYLRLRRQNGIPDLSSAVTLFLHAQRYGISVSPEDLQMLSEARTTAVELREPSPEECWSFLGILKEGRRVANTLRATAQLGLLDRFIDGFSRMMRFAPPDPAHRYTVGEHSLKIVEYLEDLRLGRETQGRHFSELLRQCAHFDMLCLAALLHDSGKLRPGSDHSETAVDLARTVATRLGLAPEKREILETLVGHHLLLVRTGRLQDLKSPTVIQSVADRLRSLEVLRHLYVFTYVDTRAVAEKNWTSMDYRDLDELYRKVHDLLTGKSLEARSEEAVRDRLGQIRRRLAASREAYDEEALRRHCDSMPAGYALNTPLDEILLHIQLLGRLDSEKVVLDVYNRPGDDFSELTVCTYDDPEPGMLAKITGVLYGCTVDIHKAQVFTMERERPLVLDTLWVRSGGMQISESRARRIRLSLLDVLTGRQTLDQFLEAAGKQQPSAIPLDSIELRNDLSEEHTVVHMIARDFEGLLYLMTLTLSRCRLDIHSAKVTTWHARAENNFYVTTASGGQIPDAELAGWKEQLVRAFSGPGARRLGGKR